jgi:acetyltransferase-like isoleucine patch superfamily enzyme
VERAQGRLIGGVCRKRRIRHRRRERFAAAAAYIEGMIAPLLALLRRLRLRAGAHVGRRVVVLGPVAIRGRGRVAVGEGVRFEATQAPIELHAGAGAEIVLERGVVLESGASIEAMRSVRIGDGARIGAFAKILDNQFHRLEGDRRERPPSSPVIVEAGATIGPRGIVLPGAHVGRGAHVGAGAVVSRRLPAGADVHGFPLVVRTRRS